MMPKKFEFHFEGEADDARNDYGCKMLIGGDLETIGILLADYARHEAARNYFEPLRILIAAFKRMQETQKTDPRRIIPPGDLNFDN